MAKYQRLRRLDGVKVSARLKETSELYERRNQQAGVGRQKDTDAQTNTPEEMEREAGISSNRIQDCDC